MALPEFGPTGLLPHGVHSASEAEFEARFVKPFPNSLRRQRIFALFQKYRAALAALGLNVTQWVNGSFVDATRLDPEDIDVVNFCHADEINAAYSSLGEVRAAQLLQNHELVRQAYQTDAYFSVTSSEGPSPQAEAEKRRLYWRDFFSRAHTYGDGLSGHEKLATPARGRKGFVQMTVGNAKLCPVVDSGFPHYGSSSII